MEPDVSICRTLYSGTPMLRKHVRAASLTAIFCCLPALSFAADNPFLPAPVAPKTAASTDSSGAAPTQGALPMPPAPGLAPVLPSLAAPLLPPPATEEQPIGKVNGELIYKDGSRYKFKAAKAPAVKKPKPAVKRKKPVKPAKQPAASAGLPPGNSPASNGVKGLGQPGVIKVLPNAVPVKPVSPNTRPTAIPSMPGKPTVVANKPVTASKPQGGKTNAVPIKVITEKK